MTTELASSTTWRADKASTVSVRRRVTSPWPCTLQQATCKFVRRALDLWAYHCKARIDFSRPGKPIDNCYVETFNGSLRDECLNVHWFETMEDAKAIVEAWRRDYNETRPHMALKDVAPQEYARQLGLQNAEN